MSRCRFEVGQPVRRAPRNCKRAPDQKWNKSGKVGSVWVVSAVDSIPWVVTKPGTCPDCWPIRVALVDFPPQGWICACQFDPIADGVPVEVKRMAEVTQ